MAHSDEKRLYLLGHPIAHSKSPVMYNAVFERLGLPWRYGFMDCPTDGEAQAFLAARDFFAINITTPYKPQAFETATVKASSARLAKGANVLVAHGDALIAYNVDGQGCIGYLEHEGVKIAGARVAVCGTGPTALAILHAASLAGAEEVLLLSRDKRRAQAVLEEYAETYRALTAAAVDITAAQPGHLGFREAYDKVGLRFGSYTTSTKAIAAADVIIDATTLGMHEGDPAPFDPALLSARQMVFDVVYGHGTTALVAAARDAGCAAFDGAGMLVSQAVAAVGIFCDIAGVGLALSSDELFAIMAQAAEFDL